MISKKDYEDLKEYWDYQRKVEYNRETVFNMADKFEGRVYNEMGPIDISTIKETLWTRVRPDDYEEPHKGWIPENSKYRFEWEEDKKSKPRPKQKWENLANELQDYMHSKREQ